MKIYLQNLNTCTTGPCHTMLLQLTPCIVFIGIHNQNNCNLYCIAIANCKFLLIGYHILYNKVSGSTAIAPSRNNMDISKDLICVAIPIIGIAMQMRSLESS